MTRTALRNTGLTMLLVAVGTRDVTLMARSLFLYLLRGFLVA